MKRMSWGKALMLLCVGVVVFFCPSPIHGAGGDALMGILAGAFTCPVVGKVLTDGKA